MCISDALKAVIAALVVLAPQCGRSEPAVSSPGSEMVRPIRSFLPSETTEGLRVAFSPDAQLLAVSPANQTPYIIELDRGTRVFEFTQDQTNAEVRFSPDGQFLAVQRGDTWLWDRITSQIISRFAGGPPAAFTPDSRKIIIKNHKNRLQLFDLGSTAPVQAAQGSPNISGEVSFSRDGTRFASTGPENSEAFVWSIPENRMLCKVPMGSRYGGKALLSPDGKSLLTSISVRTNISVWNADTGEKLKDLSMRDQVSDMAFAPRKNLFFAKDTSGDIYGWSLPGFGEHAKCEASTLRILGVSPDESLIFASNQSDIEVRTTADLRHVQSLYGHSVVWMAQKPSTPGAGEWNFHKFGPTGSKNVWVNERNPEGHTWGISGILHVPARKQLWSIGGDGILKCWPAFF